MMLFYLFVMHFFLPPDIAIYMAESGIHLFDLIADLEISNSL